MNLRLQKWVTGISVFLLIVKFAAYYATGSVSVLSDALESIVNVAAGFIGVYSLYISAKPRDREHPYGHGKIEFISAGIEGTLILSAALVILYQAVKNLLYPQSIAQLDYGMILVGSAGLVNLVIGIICIRQGNRSRSPALVSSGRHLQTDSLSTLGIIIALLLIKATGLVWIDSAVALLYGSYILITGYRIVRGSIAGIMDEADLRLLERLVHLLNANRKENWVDLHNLRVIKYGTVLHVDCHLTVPWYLNVHEAHKEIDALSELIRDEFGESLELFVHSDGCLYSQCSICIKSDCGVRKQPLKQPLEWTLDNIIKNKKHQYKDQEGSRGDV